MKKVILSIFIMVILCGCASKTNQENTLDKILKENNYVVVDVRTKEEYQDSHVKDSINIPYDEIDENTSLDKNKTILVYCRSGKRSSVAHETLKSLGYQVYDLGAYDTITLDKE